MPAARITTCRIDDLRTAATMASSKNLVRMEKYGSGPVGVDAPSASRMDDIRSNPASPARSRASGSRKSGLRLSVSSARAAATQRDVQPTGVMAISCPISSRALSSRSPLLKRMAPAADRLC